MLFFEKITLIIDYVALCSFITTGADKPQNIIENAKNNRHDIATDLVMHFRVTLFVNNFSADSHLNKSIEFLYLLKAGSEVLLFKKSR